MCCSIAGRWAIECFAKVDGMVKISGVIEWGGGGERSLVTSQMNVR